MNIGLDIDNVITEFDKTLLSAMLKEDKNKRNNGIINPKAKHISNGMFDWTQDEVEEFYKNNMQSLAKIHLPKPNCKFYIDKLINDGHKIILITNRTTKHYQNPEIVTIDWLKNNNINYHKLVFSKTPDKSDECFENSIDIMIDDRAEQCKLMRDKGVHVIVMLTDYNSPYIGNLPFVKDWKELYEVISNFKNKSMR